MKTETKKALLFIPALAILAGSLPAQGVDLGAAGSQISGIASTAAGLIGGLVGLIGIGRAAYKFSNGDTGAVTALIEGIVGLVLGQIAAGLM
jgi:hypothetical protein